MAKQMGDVLTIEDLSGYLKIPKSTLYKLVREGNIPCQKIGRHWRFHKEAVDNWLQASSNTATGRSSRRNLSAHPFGQPLKSKAGTEKHERTAAADG